MQTSLVRCSHSDVIDAPSVSLHANYVKVATIQSKLKVVYMYLWCYRSSLLSAAGYGCRAGRDRRRRRRGLSSGAVALCLRWRRLVGRRSLHWGYRTCVTTENNVLMVIIVIIVSFLLIGILISMSK